MTDFFCKHLKQTKWGAGIVCRLGLADRRIPLQRSLRAIAPYLLLLGMPVGVAACDPCDGVLSCAAPQLRHDGEVYREYLDGPAPEIRVRFTRTGGAELPGGEIEARTDASGRFSFEADGLGDGILVGTYEFYYRDTALVRVVEGVGLEPTPAVGDRRFLGRWHVPYPHINSVGRVIHRATGEAVAGAEVEFHRTSGVSIDPDPFVAVTDAFGNVALSPTPAGRGEVVGQLEVRGLGTETVIPGVRIATQVRADLRPLLGPWRIGPHLPYVGQAVWDDTGLPAANVVVEVRRTGGSEIQPASYTDRTNEWGGFSLGPVPLSSGAVEIEIVFRPPSPYRTVSHPYTLPISEKDEPPSLIETWRIPR